MFTFAAELERLYKLTLLSNGKSNKYNYYTYY